LQHAKYTQAPDFTALEHDAECLSLAHLAVELLRRCDFGAAWLGPHRHVATDLAVLHHRCHVGTHPVEAAILAPVFDQRRPGLALLDGVPQILECDRRHVRMAHDVVGLAHHFFARKP